MAKKIKTAAEVKAAADITAQVTFDETAKLMGGVGSAFVQSSIYLTAGSAFEQAHAEDADRLHFRFMLRLDWLRGDVETAQGKLARFSADLSKDAANAFRWATDAVKAAAEVKVFSIYLDLVTGRGPDVADKVSLQEALRGARSPSRSTSPMANLVEECETAAWAELAEKAGRF
jgi:hypothetical protein